MNDGLQQVFRNQYEAALSMLAAGVKHCPEAAWHGRVAAYQFCQVAFHTLFYADYYLERDPTRFKEQPFHQHHPAIFRDYEEFDDHAPRLLYEKAAIELYLAHVRQKVAATIGAETAESLSERCPFERLGFSRAELHIYNIRHIQHHAAGLILRLRLEGTGDFPWARSGWREV